MGFMEKVAATLATKYGVVTSGTYEGCQIALGNPPDEKVTTSYTFSQIIFVDGNEEKGRFALTNVRIQLQGKNDKGVQMSIRLPDGAICEFDLLLRPKDKMWMKLVKTFFGQKGGIKSSSEGGVDATIQEEQNLRFHNMVVFFQNAFICMTHKEIDFFEGYFMENNVLDELTQKVIKLYRDRVKKDAQ